VLLTGTLYAVSAWALPVATGPDNIRAAAAEHGTLLLFTLVGAHAPALLVHVGQVLLLTSVFAAALAFHTTSTRYLFALAREHVLPTGLGTTNRAGVPARACALHSLLTLTALIAYAATGAQDPLRHLLLWGTITGGFGVVLLMTATSFAATTYLTHPATGTAENWWTRRVAPTTAGILLAAALTLSLGQLPVLFGTHPGAPTGWTWILPGVYLTAATTGLARAVHLRRTHPHTLSRIGHGAQTPTLI
jgi:amino acid transporter